MPQVAGWSFRSLDGLTMGWYPVTLQLAGRRCLVIGGGAVAERKVEGILAAGADVTVISPRLTRRLADRAAARSIVHRARVYRRGDVRGFVLAFAATGDTAVNAAVCHDSRRHGVWVNAADDPAHCDFILPSVLRRGELTVAVATGGTAPALARALRGDLQRRLGHDYAVLAGVMAEVRRELRARGQAPDASTWRRALDVPLRRLAARGRRPEARRRLLARLGAS
jgi:siroheme synthase-like protein